MEEEIVKNFYTFNVRSFYNIKYLIDQQFIYQMDNIIIVIYYNNDLYIDI